MKRTHPPDDKKKAALILLLDQMNKLVDTSVKSKIIDEKYDEIKKSINHCFLIYFAGKQPTSLMERKILNGILDKADHSLTTLLDKCKEKDDNTTQSIREHSNSLREFITTEKVDFSCLKPKLTK